MVLSYRFAMRLYSGLTLLGSMHEGSVELLSQLTWMTSEPIQSCDSSRHHEVELDVEEFQLKGVVLEEFELEPNMCQLRKDCK